jgi:hypothetical protein
MRTMKEMSEIAVDIVDIVLKIPIRNPQWGFRIGISNTISTISRSIVNPVARLPLEIVQTYTDLVAVVDERNLTQFR